MLIDWFTVGAQVLNFLVLVWLLKRFLYKPVLDAIDTREKQIAAELAGADQKKADAQKESDDYRHKSDLFDQQRAALLAQAASDADAERKRLIDAAGRAADDLQARRQKAQSDSARSLSDELGSRTQQQVFAIARRALKDLASTELEARACEVFNQRLRGLEGQARSDMAEALRSTSGPAVVRSAFELPAAQREAVQKAVNETFSMAASLRFDTDPELVSGIELIANGRTVAWSIAEYLRAMDREVDQLLTGQAAAGVPKTGDIPDAAGAKASAAHGADAGGVTP